MLQPEIYENQINIHINCKILSQAKSMELAFVKDVHLCILYNSK